MGNISQICCQQSKIQSSVYNNQQKKWHFVPAKHQQFHQQLFQKKLQSLNLKPIKINQQNHPGAKIQPPMKQTQKQFIYNGSWLNDKPQGYGIVFFKNGQYFQGQFYQGVAYGIGRYILQQKTYFQGNIKDNIAVGIGKFICPQFQFEGEWLDSKPHKGKYILVNYTQILLNDVDNGQITWTDDRKYVGQIKDLNPHGKGRLQFKNGNFYEGEFYEGTMHGKGTYNWQDGSKYIGNYKNGEKEGFGIINYKNGIIYQGQWRNNKQHGKGKLIKDEKVLYEGYFKNGQPTDEQDFKKDNIENVQKSNINIENMIEDESSKGLKSQIKKQIQFQQL